jgi:hypothetical protein
MGAVIFAVKRFLPVSLDSFIVLSVLGLIIYLSSMLGILGLSLLEDAKRSFKTIFTKH